MSDGKGGANPFLYGQFVFEEGTLLEIYHVSDLDIGKGRLFWERTPRVRFFLEELYRNAKFENAANKFLIVTGDITQAGEESQYETAIELLLPFKERIFFVPGNHDYGSFSGLFFNTASARLFDKRLGREFLDELEFLPKVPVPYPILHEKEKVLLIGLNSCLCRKGARRLGQKAGETFGLIGYEQLLRLRTLLNSKKFEDYTKIVLVHHIPDAAAEGFAMELLDREDLVSIAVPKVEAFCFGHEGGMTRGNPIKKWLGFEAPRRKMHVGFMDLVKNLGEAKAKVLAVPQGPWSLGASSSVDEFKCNVILVQGNRLRALTVDIRKPIAEQLDRTTSAMNPAPRMKKEFRSPEGPNGSTHSFPQINRSQINGDAGGGLGRRKSAY